MAKLNKRNQKNKIELLEDANIFVGIDVHKRSYAVSVVTRERVQIDKWVQSADADQLVQSLEKYGAREIHCVYEADQPDTAWQESSSWQASALTWLQP